jgi:hypothetical protein
MEKFINQQSKKKEKQTRERRMEKNVKFFKTPHSPEVIIATPSTLYILIPFTADDPGDTCNNGFSI